MWMSHPAHCRILPFRCCLPNREIPERTVRIIVLFAPGGGSDQRNQLSMFGS